MERGSGLLVHISSLPSRHGIGTFGAQARRFIRFLANAKQKYWQVLPLNPTGFGDSPYQSFSAFALNPYFIDLDYLVREGYLTKEEVRPIRGGSNSSYVDYGKVYNQRFDILYLAYQRAFENEKEEIVNFYKFNKKWLEDYALFMTIKDMFDGISWQEWPREYRLHTRKAIQTVKETKLNTYYFYIWQQYKAYSQFKKLRKYAKRKGIKLIGDMPLYVSLDSADVWGNPQVFQLDKSRRPVKVAGVPPDFFSEDGQLWGNPLYDYNYLEKTNYRWWKLRFKTMSKLYDYLRIDHFRGFESYWAIPVNEKTAINGEWIKGPGYSLFEACKKELSKINIIAEDLGIITDEVIKLKEKCNFPGLKLYQFAFENYEKNLMGEYDDIDRYKDRLNSNYLTYEEAKLAKLVNPYLPHNYETNCVAYIGTHDNDIEDHFIEEHPELWAPMQDYLKINGVEHINDTLIGSLMRSCADVVIFLPQDILRLGKNSRINTPGVASGNWRFRFRKEHFSKGLAEHLAIMVDEAHR